MGFFEKSIFRHFWRVRDLRPKKTIREVLDAQEEWHNRFVSCPPTHTHTQPCKIVALRRKGSHHTELHGRWRWTGSILQTLWIRIHRYRRLQNILLTSMLVPFSEIQTLQSIIPELIGSVYSIKLVTWGRSIVYSVQYWPGFIKKMASSNRRIQNILRICVILVWRVP